MDRFNVKVFYSRYPNFGDMLNEYLLQKLLYVKVEHCMFTDADMTAVGSILDKMLSRGNIKEYYRELQKEALTEKPIHIWGTGLMYPYSPDEQRFVRPLIIHALRGELTRKTVSSILGSKINCVLGDPGILASRVIPVKEKIYDMGIIPHVVDLELPFFEKMRKHYPNSVIIDVRAEPESVIKQISMCRRTISTSLHGLVISDSYGIPNCWCEASDNVLGNGFKFHDYFSSFGSDRKPVDLRSCIFPDDDRMYLTSFQRTAELRKQQMDLIKSFPYFLLLEELGRKTERKLRNIKGIIQNGYH